VLESSNNEIYGHTSCLGYYNGLTCPCGRTKFIECIGCGELVATIVLTPFEICEHALNLRKPL